MRGAGGALASLAIEAMNRLMADGATTNRLMAAGEATERMADGGKTAPWVGVSGSSRQANSLTSQAAGHCRGGTKCCGGARCAVEVVVGLTSVLADPWSK